MDHLPFQAPTGPPSTCVHCGKRIVLQPGTERWRSTEYDIAVDRMACDKTSDRHHQPAEPAEDTPEPAKLRRIDVSAPPRTPEFRAGDFQW